MVEIIMGYYIGLFIFALNGLQWMAMRQRDQALKVREERLAKLLLRRRIK